MSSQQRLARAFLTTLDQPDDATLAQLVVDHGVLDTAEMVAAAGYRDRDWETDTLRLLDRARRHDVRFLVPADEEWPATVSRSSAGAGPLGLWVSGTGEPAALLRRSVVVLGSRTATPYAAALAFQLTGELSAAGWTVVTSGAVGVGSAALRGALVVDRPAVAVPLGGALRPAPVVNVGLLRRVRYSGLVLSQSAGRPAERRTDIARQIRLLAAAGAAVVLIEPNPGTVASAVAEHAQAAGRPVYVVPGPVSAPRPARVRPRSELVDRLAPAAPGLEPVPLASDFAHELIRAGAARLVRGAGDVLADLAAGGAR